MGSSWKKNLMTEDRKAELAQMCAVQIRQATVIMKSLMSDYGYHFVESIFDAEVAAMMARLDGKPVTESDMPVLQELVMADLWHRLKAAHCKQRDAAFGKLIANYPDIVVHYADFAFDIGWIPLVRDAVERMRTYPEAWKCGSTAERKNSATAICTCRAWSPSAARWPRSSGSGKRSDFAVWPRAISAVARVGCVWVAMRRPSATSTRPSSKAFVKTTGLARIRGAGRTMSSKTDRGARNVGNCRRV